MTSTSMSSTVTFPSGLPGFEECRTFVVVSGGDFGPCVGVRGLDGRCPFFLAVDRRTLAGADVDPVSAADRIRVGASDTTALLVLCLVTARESGPVVNLAAPLVINPETMLGVQVVPNDQTPVHEMPLVGARPCS